MANWRCGRSGTTTRRSIGLHLAGGMSETVTMRSSSVGLVAPAALFLTLFPVLPVGFLLASSQLTQTDAGHIGWPLPLGRYAHFFNTTLYSRVLATTPRSSAVTTLAAAILGYPVALAMVRAPAWISRAVTAIVVAPMVVSVVVRTAPMAGS